MVARATLAAAAALLLGAPVANAQAVPDLPGAVRVAAGPGAGYVRVHLPRPVAMHGDDDADGRVRLRMRGGRDMRGLMLRAEQPGGPGWPEGQRPHLGLVGGGDRDIDVEIGMGLPPLPAGDYRLYVYTQGSPMTVDLELPGLDGAASLALTDGARMTGGALESRSTNPDRPMIGRTLDVGPGEVEALVTREYRFADGQSGFIGTCDETTGGSCPQDEGAVPSGRASSGASGSTGSYGLDGPAHLDFAISGRSNSGPPPALTGFAGAVEFDVAAPLGPQPPLPEPPVAAAPAPASPGASAPAGRPTVAAVGALVRRSARVSLSCAAAAPCAGTIRLTSGKPVAFRIGAGAGAAIRLPLTRAQRPTLARRGRLRVTVVVRIPGRPGVRRQVLIRA